MLFFAGAICCRVQKGLNAVIPSHPLWIAWDFDVMDRGHAEEGRWGGVGNAVYFYFFAWVVTADIWLLVKKQPSLFVQVDLCGLHDIPVLQPGEPVVGQAGLTASGAPFIPWQPNSFVFLCFSGQCFHGVREKGSCSCRCASFLFP